MIRHLDHDADRRLRRAARTRHGQRVVRARIAIALLILLGVATTAALFLREAM